MSNSDSGNITIWVAFAGTRSNPHIDPLQLKMKHTDHISDMKAEVAARTAELTDMSRMKILKIIDPIPFPDEDEMEIDGSVPALNELIQRIHASPSNGKQEKLVKILRVNDKVGGSFDDNDDKIQCIVMHPLLDVEDDAEFIPHSDSGNITIWVALIGTRSNPHIDPLQLKMKHTDHISDMKAEVAARTAELRSDERRMKILKIMDPVPFPDEDEMEIDGSVPALNELIQRIHASPSNGKQEKLVKILRVNDKVGGCFDDNDDKIQCIVMHPLLDVEDDAEFIPHPNSSPYRDAVAFRIETKGHKPDWNSVRFLNRWQNETVLSKNIADIVHRARRAPKGEEEIANSIHQSLKASWDLCDADYRGLLDKAYREAPDDEALPYKGCCLELRHYQDVVEYAARCQNLSTRATGFHTLHSIELHHIVFFQFAVFWFSEGNGTCTFGEGFPFYLFALGEEAGNKKTTTYKYRPMPDAAFLLHNIPRFLVAFDSSCNAEDEQRLLLQMTIALRLVIDKYSEDKKVFLMGAYFTKYKEINRYFVYCDAEKKIHFHQRVYRMTRIDQLTVFLFEFYNYAAYVKENFAAEQFSHFAAHNKAIENNYPSLHIKMQQSRSAGHHDSEKSSNQSDTEGQGVATTEALQRSGYKVFNYVACDDFEPLFPLPSHVVEATSATGQAVIAKLPDSESEELFLLQELSMIKSPHNHVIPLLDTVESSLGPIVILPRGISLEAMQAQFNHREHLEGKYVQLSRELVEGIAFLHRQKIAHRDIKPHNLIYCLKTRRLHIIDFDLAMRCEDVESMIKSSSGTPGWSAPEIIHDNGNKPKQSFSPIRADLWSCGSVLRDFSKRTTETNSELSLLADRLSAEDPKQRPLLHELVDESADFWTSGRLWRALGGPEQEPAKEQPTVYTGHKKDAKRRSFGREDRQNTKVNAG